MVGAPVGGVVAGEHVDERAEYVERAVRALGLSGRRLMRGDAGWRVMASADRRRRGRLLLSDGEVEALVKAGRLKAAETDVYVLADVAVVRMPELEPWAFIVASKREDARREGVGFAALAWRARRGNGPLTMRHLQAGLRLITDVEQRESSRGLTMDWDAGPVDRQRRSGTSGDLRAMAMKTSERVRQVKRHVSEYAFSLVWALCIEALPLRQVKAKFGIATRNIEGAVAEALEEVAAAYDRYVA